MDSITKQLAEASEGDFDLEQFRRETPIASLPGFSSESLNAERVMCANGEIPGYQQRLAAQDVFFPDAAEYCPEVLREVMRRDEHGYMYAGTAAARGIEEAILDDVQAAAMAGHTSYEINGVTYPLGCPTAFDAGVGFGYRNPDASIAPNLSDEQLNGVRDACYAPGTTMSTQGGVIAGARYGQELARELVVGGIDANALDNPAPGPGLVEGTGGQGGPFVPLSDGVVR